MAHVGREPTISWRVSPRNRACRLRGIELAGIERADRSVERGEPRLLLTPLRNQGRTLGRCLFDHRKRRVGSSEEVDRAGGVGRKTQRAARNHRLHIRLHQIKDVSLAAEIVASGRVVVAVIDEPQDVLQIARRISLVGSRDGAGHRELRFGDIALGVGGRIAGHRRLGRILRRDWCRRDGAEGEHGRESVHKSFHQGSP